jgi:head-tail adaptor
MSEGCRPFEGNTMRNLILRSTLLTMLALSSAAAQRDTAFTWSKRLPDGARLAIKNLNGPIDVRAASGERVEVRATIRVEARGNASDVTFDVREHSATDVEICTVYRGRSDCDPDNSWNEIRVSVRYTVEIPKGLRFRASTGSGDISVAQTVAELDVSTGSGDLVVRESAGRVTASTGSGDVTISAAGGPVRVSTGSGRIIATTSSGPVDASTGSGDIDVKMAALPDNASMSFTTGSGSVRVTLPGDFNGEVDANTASGSINTDFELKVQGRLSTSRLRGVIGTGNGPVIKMRSGSGRLEIRKG